MSKHKYTVDHDRKGHACVIWSDEQGDHLVCQAMDGDTAQQIANALQDRDYLTAVTQAAYKVIDAFLRSHRDLVYACHNPDLESEICNLETTIGGAQP